jgi:hypothetical protein
MYQQRHPEYYRIRSRWRRTWQHVLLFHAYAQEEAHRDEHLRYTPRVSFAFSINNCSIQFTNPTYRQFGNMLVLTSVFKSKLYPLLPSDTWLTKANLAALFKRTINVLSDVAPNSPILRMDLEILRNVQKQEGLLI